jgi:hypothetical protein
MFPHDITAFTLQSDGITYIREFIEGVYWEGSAEIVQDGKSINNVSNVSVFIPYEKGIGSIKMKTIIVKGEHPAITSMSELDGIVDKITVDFINDRDVSSPLDHFHIKGV